MDDKKDEVKQEHYVPESYLKRFTNEKGKICVYDYDKKELRENQSTNKIAKINGFYDFDKEELEKLQKANVQVDKQYIEKMFATSIEPALKDIIDKLSNLDSDFGADCPSIQNAELKLSISYLLVFQLLRTKSYREFFVEFLGDEKSGATQQKFTLINQDVIENLAKTICHMSWTLCYNISKKPYITSDNPVVVFDENFYYGHNALVGDGKKMIFYPLTPQILLQILSPEYTGITEGNIIKVFLIDAKSAEFVDFPNSQQMENAYRYVFTNYDFPEAYFGDKLAGYKNLPLTPDVLEYSADLDDFICNGVPYLSELLERLDNPHCTKEEALSIAEEAKKVCEKANDSREKCGKERWKII